ncbi:MAG: SDR family NAD(P)-dependent oxidoreductase [Chitinophagaceae bacterium]|jgi:short-subunit dehydrogenase|nr:SDR family NAD(P)-dependent oxidoreductase [Chitinophagaceae bacterium]
MKRVIIVGASSGIGKCLAEKYAYLKNKVGITGRRCELLNRLKLDQPNIVTACFDITESTSLRHLELLKEQIGGLDLLIISAGGGEVNEKYEWEKEDRMVQLNVNAFLEIAHWAFSLFMKQGHGQLAVISSIAANRGNSISPAYSAAKAFQTVYLEGLAIRAHKSLKPVYITTIEPGFVATKKHNGKVFWMVPVEKAAKQIIQAIENKKTKVYISKRWGLVAWFLKRIPYNMYRRL